MKALLIILAVLSLAHSAMAQIIVAPHGHVTVVKRVQPMELVSAEPKEREMLAHPPTAVVLSFSRPVEALGSYIKVNDPFGRRLNDGKVNADGKVMTVELPELLPGKHKVMWKARCRCEMDDISGVYYFTYEPLDVPHEGAPTPDEAYPPAEEAPPQ